MNRRRLVPLLIAASVVLAAAVPAGASARAAGPVFPTVALTAKTAGGGFSGTFEIRRFRVRGPALVAFGRLNGRLRDRRYPSAQRVRNATLSFVVAVGPVPTDRSCARVAFFVAGQTAPLVGLPATFAPRTLVLRPRRASGPATSELLCGTSAATAANAPAVVTVHLLNALRLALA